MTAQQKINRIRAVVTNKTAAKIDGQLLDLYSAGAIITVYDALSEGNRLKFLSVPVQGMAEMAFKLLKKAEG